MREAPHYHGHRARLRERFRKGRLEGFADHEVVELLLTLAIPRQDVKQPAKRLLDKFGDLRGILDAPLQEVESVAGVGPTSATALKVIREAATLYLQQRAEGVATLESPKQLEDFWRMRIGALKNEVFEVAYLDSRLRLVRQGVERLEEGTVDRASVSPRRVVEGALQRGAPAVVLAHNHPGGDVQPSEKDKLLTRAVVLAAESVQLRVVDHLIVSPDEVFSFKREGLL